MTAITLSAGIRSNLNSLQKTNNLLNLTQNHLATGKKVTTAIDNPNSFFKAANLNDRASKLESRLDSMGQAISAIKSADQAITSIRSITEQLKAVAEETKAETDSNVRGTLGTQFNTLLDQIHYLAKDAVYSGTNFLQGSNHISYTTDKGNQTLTVQFNEQLDKSTLTLQGFTISNEDARITAGIYNSLSISGAEAGLTNVTIQSHYNSSLIPADATGTTTTVNFSSDNYKISMDAVITNIEKFDTQLNNASKLLANNLSIITTRQDFTSAQVNILQEGADKLTLADLNEEGANLLALNTSQQLGISSLSLASQASQAVLRLVG